MPAPPHARPVTSRLYLEPLGQAIAVFVATAAAVLAMAAAARARWFVMHRALAAVAFRLVFSALTNYVVAAPSRPYAPIRGWIDFFGGRAVPFLNAVLALGTRLGDGPTLALAVAQVALMHHVQARGCGMSGWDGVGGWGGGVRRWGGMFVGWLVA